MRQQLRAARRALGPAQRQALSARICGHILNQLVPAMVAEKTLKPGAAIGLYAASSSEVDLDAAITVLLSQGYKVALPYMGTCIPADSLAFVRTAGLQSLVRGPWGLRQPPLSAFVHKGIVLAHEMPLLVLPCVGIDDYGNRLGGGLGLYDRFLARHCGFRLGACFGCQRVERLPCDAHDVPLSGWVSEKGIVAGKM